MWKLGRKQTPLALSAPPGAGDLTDSFNAARYGHYFRTRAMLDTATGADQWLYAVQDPFSLRCTLMKVQTDYLDPHNKMERRTKVQEKMTLIDALHWMARFEDLTANKDFCVMRDNDPEDFGLLHFQAFANREGLVFDYDKRRFVPTAKGHVTESGLFRADDLARAEQHATDLEEYHGLNFALPEPAATFHLADNAIDHLLHTQETGKALKKAVALHQSLDQIEIFWQERTSKDLLSFSERKLSINFFDLNILNKIRDDIDNEHGKNNKKKCLKYFEGRRSYQVYDHLLRIAQDMDLPSPELDRFHKKLLERRKLTLPLSLVRQNFISMNACDLAGPSGGGGPTAVKRMKTHMEAVQKAARNLGYSTEALALINASVFSDTPHEVFAENQRMTDSLYKAHAEYLSRANKEQTRLASLYPPPGPE